jgi:putative adhesin
MSTHQTPQPPRLRLDLPAGRIEITTWDQPVTAVSVEPMNDDQASIEAAAAVREDLRDVGGRQELIVEAPGKRSFLGFRREPEIRYTIQAPHGCEVVCKTASADVSALGRLGAVEITTVSGDITLGDVDGDAELKTVSGDVESGRIAGSLECSTVSGDLDVGPVGGDATTKSVSGDVRLAKSGGSVGAKTVSGDVLLDAVSSGEVRIQTVSGDITVGVTPGARLWMDVSTASGSTESELDPLENDGLSREVDLRITGKSTSGDVRLFRAKAVAAGVQPAGK